MPAPSKAASPIEMARPIPDPVPVTKATFPWRLKLGSVIGVATLLGAEMYASTRGLGFEIIVAMQKLNLVYGYVGMFASAVVIYILWLCLTAIESAAGRSVAYR